MQTLPEKNLKFPEGFAWPNPTEFYITAVSTVGFMIIEHISKAILPQFFVGIVNTKTSESKEVKLEKMA